MNKSYFIAPILLLIAFIGLYSVHRSGYKEREAARTAQIAAELAEKNQAELEARKAAMSEAIAQAEQRKKDREIREAKDKADKEARQLAIDARDRAFREQEKYTKQIERLKKDIEAEEAVLAKLAAARKEAEAEKAFLQDFVSKSQANVQALQGLLTKLNTPAVAAAPVAK